MSRFKKTGRLAPVALMSAIGLVIPAAAVAHGMTSHAGVTYTANGGCDHHRGAPAGGHDKDKCKTPTPRPTPTRRAGCFDIDSAIRGNDKFLTVVCNGQVFALVVDETGTPTPTTSGFVAVPGAPSGVIDATVAVQGLNNVIITVLTESGTVSEGVCGTAPAPPPGPGRVITTCTFTPLPTPPNNT